MKKINTGFAFDPSPQQPFTTKSLDFLQDANKEMITAICRNIISNHGLTYSSSVPYFISQYNTSFISDGAVFFNGELYILEENVATLAYATIDTTPNATADPLLFSDGVDRNVHNNRYLTFTNTLLGSLFSIADIVDISKATTPPKPVIAKFAALTNVTTVAATPATVIFPSEILDADSQYDNTTGNFKGKKLGVFRFDVSLNLGITASVSEILSINFNLNGVLHDRKYWVSGNYAGSGNYISCNFTGLFNVVNVNDIYTISITTINNETVNLDGTLCYTFVS